MGDITIDLDDLENLSTRLRAVSSDLQNAEAFSRDVAGVVGDWALASVVLEFADRWNVRRHDLIEKIDVTAAAAQAIHDTFVELDAHISGNLSRTGLPSSESNG